MYEADNTSDSSSSISDLPYPSRTLMSSPLKPPMFPGDAIFSDAINSSNGLSTGRRKRTYMASFDDFAAAVSPSKRLRAVSPTAHKSFAHKALHSGTTTSINKHQLIQSSPIKPRQEHFTTTSGPNVSFFQTQSMTQSFSVPNFTVASARNESEPPVHSLNVSAMRSSPPRTPPMQSRTLRSKNGKPPAKGDKTGEQGADLLLYLAASPSPAKRATRGQMEPPSTPPQQRGHNKMDLPSSMMTTPGGGNLFPTTPKYPTTPGQNFDFADFVNITPSPAQKVWRTPGPMTSLPVVSTPPSLARKLPTPSERLLSG